jgi:ribosomal protein S30
MADTRRKIVVDLDFYNDLKRVAAKDKRKLLPQLRIILAAYKELVPRQKDIEKRVVRLERASGIR